MTSSQWTCVNSIVRSTSPKFSDTVDDGGQTRGRGDFLRLRHGVVGEERSIKNRSDDGPDRRRDPEDPMVAPAVVPDRGGQRPRGVHAATSEGPEDDAQDEDATSDSQRRGVCGFGVALVPETREHEEQKTGCQDFHEDALSQGDLLVDGGDAEFGGLGGVATVDEVERCDGLEGQSCILMEYYTRCISNTGTPE